MQFGAPQWYRYKDHFEFRGLAFNATSVNLTLTGRKSLSNIQLGILNLTDKGFLDRSCAGATYDRFTSCRGNVLLWRSPFNQSTNRVIPGKKFSMHSSAHIIGVRNALLSRDGVIFDTRYSYFHGGCAYRSWHTSAYNFNYSFAPPLMTVRYYSEPVITINQPYEDQIGHEILEVYSILIALKPVLLSMPNIKIVARSKLGHKKYFPLLRACGVEPESLNIDVLDNREELVFAPLIITVLMEECLQMIDTIAAQMIKGIAKLPTLQLKPQRQILWYDRKFDSTRHIPLGEKTLELLKQQYEPAYKVSRFIGNESFDEIVRITSGTNYFIGVHGSGLINTLFMHENTTIIEIRPTNFQLDVFEAVAHVLGFNHYVFLCGKRGWGGPVMLNPEQFLAYLKPIINP